MAMSAAALQACPPFLAPLTRFTSPSPQQCSNPSFTPLTRRAVQCQCSSNEAPKSVQKSESSCTRRQVLSLTAAALAASVLPEAPAEAADVELVLYYGTAAGAASYGGYGGNASKRDQAEYTYLVPSTWKERVISKVEKGTNGTDSEFFNPAKKVEKVYTTFLAGIRKLGNKDTIINDLALSDVNLQDAIGSAENIDITERTDSSGQLYYDYEIDSPVGHDLITVTVANNKLYALFVVAPNSDWSKDKKFLKKIRDSFTTNVA